MAYQQIPISSDSPSYEFKVLLETVNYTLRVEYSARSDAWSLSIMDEVGNPLIMGMALVAGVDLNGRHVAAKGPPGNFFLVDTQNGKSDPGEDDLGKRFQLFYRESTTPDGQ
jgi:hypothetical protein